MTTTASPILPGATRYYDAPTVRPLIDAWRTLSEAADAAETTDAAQRLHAGSREADALAWAEMNRLVRAESAAAQG